VQVDGPRLGVAYYPEQWPRERWRTDAALMAEAGLSLVRLAEFAWARLEPEEGRFDFAWLDEVLEILGEAGLGVVLGTPTAAPPAWLVERRPEILPVRADGRRVGFGHRRHYCPNQPAFLEASERIVTALAERYGRDARVVAWQIDNEFGGRCFCERCRESFQEWLRERYGSLEHLNESWGTAFWSQTYSSWRQIPLPEGRPVPLPDGFLPSAPNPGLALDYRRFASDSLVRFQRLQIRILRERCAPEQQITHNLMGFRYPELDYHALAEELDFVSWSNYPLLDRSGRWSTAALGADAMRGLKGGPFWVLEQQLGPLGWGILHTPRRGQMRLQTYQAIAHGAEAVFYFRWRTARFGTEQHWHGIVDHDARPRRRYSEVRELARELARAAPSLAAVSPLAETAVLHDYDSRFALQIQPTNVALGYEDTIQRHYEALRQLGLGVDVVSPASDLSRYRLVVAANLYTVDAALAAALAAYVEAGGWLVLAPRVGVKDRANALPERPFPAWLDGLAGLEVIDYASVPDEVSVAFAGEGGSGLAGEFAGWYEELELRGARPLAAYLEGDFAGTTAVAAREAGRGRVLYLAGAAYESTLRALYRELAAEAGLPLLELPEGIEVVRATNGKGSDLLLVLNHTAEACVVDVGAGPWHDLVDDRSGEGALRLEPFGVALVSAFAPVPSPPASREGR
jgi:beta-galactosidase